MNPLDEPCTTVVELVTDYLEEVLPARQHVTFETHVVFCPGCSLFLRQIQDVVKGLRALPVDPIDPGERESLVKKLGEGG